MIQFRQMDIGVLGEELNSGNISLDGLIFTSITPNKAYIIYDTEATEPVAALTDCTSATDGEAIRISYWNSCLVIIEKTGAGSCGVSIQARQKEGTWFDLPNTTGGAETHSLAAGAQNVICQVDLVGWYQLRVRLYSVVGDVLVNSTISRGY